RDPVSGAGSWPCRGVRELEGEKRGGDDRASETTSPDPEDRHQEERREACGPRGEADEEGVDVLADRQEQCDRDQQTAPICNSLCHGSPLRSCGGGRSRPLEALQSAG